MIHALLLLSLAVPQTGENVTALLEAATRNKSLIKTKAVLVSGTTVVLDDAQKAAGEHGAVKISGLLGTDGKIIEAHVALSSRSPTLDASTLAAVKAARFTPAKDANGNAIATLYDESFQFENFSDPGAGRGILQYRCEQFVRDEDWWSRTWPSEEPSYFYTMMRGMDVLLDVSSPDVQRSLQAEPTRPEKKQDFKIIWRSAIDGCRSNPNTPVIDMMGIVGRAARRLAQNRKGSM